MTDEHDPWAEERALADDLDGVEEPPDYLPTSKKRNKARRMKQNEAKAANKPRKPRGRPIDVELVRRLARINCTQAEITAVCCVSPTRWAKEVIEGENGLTWLQRTMVEESAVGNASIRRKLWDLLEDGWDIKCPKCDLKIGVTIPSQVALKAAQFLAKQHLGMAERHEHRVIAEVEGLDPAQIRDRAIRILEDQGAVVTPPPGGWPGDAAKNLLTG